VSKKLTFLVRGDVGNIYATMASEIWELIAHSRHKVML